MTDKWMPIETAPKDGTEILVTCFGNVFPALYSKTNCTNDSPFFAASCDGEIQNIGSYYRHESDYRPVTHWMPLPDPPKDTTHDR